MKPPRFAYAAPTTVERCIELLVEHGDDAKVLAGGQSLVPLMNMRLATPGVVIDLNRIAGLSSVRDTDDGLAIGASTRHHVVATHHVVRERLPLLAAAASLIGYPAIRYRGTIGGSLAHADPAAELPCAALALDAEIEVVGPAGRRSIRAEDFFVTYFTTVLEPSEIVTEVRFPTPMGRFGWDFQEFARKTGDFALAAVAIGLELEDGRVSRARIGVAAGADRPLRVTAAEEVLAGRTVEAAALDDAAAAVASALDPPGDVHASEGFRRHLFQVLTRRGLEKAARAGGST